jgi:mono/diheme cytochrome c family protein
VAGKTAFVELQCANCHSVFGEAEFARPPEYAGLVVPLGGEVRVVKTYGELVTAIIHPSESIRPDVHKQYVDAAGNSIMPDYTGRMTTRQLIDIAAYLQQHYEVVIPQQPTNYYPYGVDLVP